MEIFQVFVTMFSKLSAADLFYVENKKVEAEQHFTWVLHILYTLFLPLHVDPDLKDKMYSN